MGSMKRALLAAVFVLSLSIVHAADTLRVMTFNVRLPVKGDGVNYWDNRRDLAVETIRRRAPDLMGTQELYFVQGEYIVEKLPEYAWFGLSRRGNHEDEHMGVFYRKDRLKVTDSGNYWLSETPDVAGSMSWGINYSRLVTWAVFEDTRNGRRFLYYNTHFPHRDTDEEARINCAKIIAERLRARPPDETILLTGDFNTDVERQPHRVLTEQINLRDAWRDVAAPAGPKGTFHEFKGSPGADRIDWVLYRGGLKPVSVETITDNVDGRYPSDHFPVLAVFEWQ